jgi:hypothetical protein
MTKIEKIILILCIIIMLSPIGIVTTLALQEPPNSPLESLQSDFRKTAEQRIFNQWTKPHTIIFTTTGRTFKHATKVSPDGVTCSFLSEGKHYFISGTFTIEEE